MKYGLARMKRNDVGRSRLHTNQSLKKSSACERCAKTINGYDDDVDNDNDNREDDNAIKMKMKMIRI